MSRSKTIGTIIVSLLIGVITLFITTPKKVQKKEKFVSEPLDESMEPKEDLFI